MYVSLDALAEVLGRTGDVLLVNILCSKYTEVIHINIKRKTQGIVNCGKK